MTNQYEMQYKQQTLAIEQSYKQQLSQLEMAKTQRDMAIQQQAAQMMAQAQQYQMQVEMQASMAKAYGSGFAGTSGPAVPDAGGDAGEHGEGLRQRVRGLLPPRPRRLPRARARLARPRARARPRRAPRSRRDL